MKGAQWFRRTHAHWRWQTGANSTLIHRINKVLLLQGSLRFTVSFCFYFTSFSLRQTPSNSPPPGGDGGACRGAV